MIKVSLHIIAFKHEIKDLKVRGGKNHVDENLSEHGTINMPSRGYYPALGLYSAGQSNNKNGRLALKYSYSIAAFLLNRRLLNRCFTVLTLSSYLQVVCDGSLTTGETRPLGR